MLEELGATLQQARQKKSLSLEELEIRTKIKVRYLDAIECGDLSRLPAEVYLKGFLRGYAKVVGLDPDEIITQYQYVTSSDSAQDHRRQLRRKKVAARRLGRIIALSVVLVVSLAYLAYNYSKSLM